MRSISLVVVLGLSVTVASGQDVPAAADLQVLGVEPAAHALTAPVDATIVVQFDKPVKRESVVPLRTFWAFGRWSGTAIGTFDFSNDDRTVTLIPNQPFSAGETVMVILSHDIEAVDGTTLRSAGYSYQFRTRSNPNRLDFEQVGVLSTKKGGGNTTYSGTSMAAPHVAGLLLFGDPVANSKDFAIDDPDGYPDRICHD